MGGDRFPVFEEVKESSSDMLIDRVVTMMRHQPIYFSIVMGIFCLVIGMQLFNIRDQAHIQNNPAVQYELKRIQEDDAEFEAETRARFKHEQRKRRLRHREYMKKYRQGKIDKLSEEKKTKVLERLQKRREAISQDEEKLYEHAVWVELVKKRYISRLRKKELRRIVRNDVKQMRKLTDEKVYGSDEEIMTLEDKIYYGSDSSGASDENYKAIMGEAPRVPSDTSSEFLVDKADLEEYDSEEGEYEMYDSEYDSEEGEYEMEEGEDELAFDPREEEKYEDEKSDGEESQGSSQRSTKVIEFDEEGNFLNMKDDDSSRASNQGDEVPMTLEMTDLSSSSKKKTKSKSKANELMREFVPEGKKNASQKKREKRKAKKERELKAKEEEEQRQKAKALKEAQAALSKKEEVVYDGKILKKKVLPKRTIADEKGGLDWEVTEKKKSVVVAEDPDGEWSD